ncbi:hypothetical protein L9F63_022163, partial [Diploptera punctata]
MTEESIPNWLLEEDVLLLDRALLRFCALLPGNETSDILWRGFIRFLMCSLMGITMIGGFIEAYYTNDFMGYVECGTVCITQVKCLFKFAAMFAHEKELRYVLDNMMKNFYIHENVAKEEILSTVKATKRTAWYVSVPYICTFMSTVVLMGLDKASSLLYRPPEETFLGNNTNETIVEFKRIFPLRVWLPMNEQLSPNYEIGYVFLLGVFSFEIYSTSVADTFIALIMMFLSAQFQLLGSAIQHARTNVSVILESKKNNSSRE